MKKDLIEMSRFKIKILFGLTYIFIIWMSVGISLHYLLKIEGAKWVILSGMVFFLIGLFFAVCDALALFFRGYGLWEGPRVEASSKNKD